MKILIAIDSFKGSLSSEKAANAIRRGILSVDTHAEITSVPVADGGEGTVDTLVSGLNGEIICVPVTGPVGNIVNARYGWLPGPKTAVFEMAQAAGLPLVPKTYRNPINTTTYGVGELLKDALDRGFRRFIIGIGGSATNDCGLGMLQALGCRFLEKNGSPVGIYGRDVRTIANIDCSNMDSRIKECEIMVACDVTNPLCGPNGASAVYAPQKGATPEIVAQMNADHFRFSELVKKTLCIDARDFAGAGAAGGLGYAFKVFLNAKLQSGVSLILDTLGFDQAVANADLVITGEGRLDHQTAMGKLPVGVAQYAKRHGTLVVALSGCVTPGATECNKHGIDAYFPILAAPCSEAQAMDESSSIENLERTAEQIFRLIVAANHMRISET